MSVDEVYVRYTCGVRRIRKMTIVAKRSNETADQSRAYRDRSCFSYGL